MKKRPRDPERGGMDLQSERTALKAVANQVKLPYPESLGTFGNERTNALGIG